MVTGTGFDGSMCINNHTLTISYAMLDTAINQAMSKQINFKLLVTGNLVYLATMLGKENSSGHHCYICMSKKSEWQSFDHPKGKLWTYNDLVVTGEEAQATVKRIKGITNLPLLKHIGIDCYCAPWMHSSIGIGNVILDEVIYDFNTVLD